MKTKAEQYLYDKDIYLKCDVYSPDYATSFKALDILTDFATIQVNSERERILGLIDDEINHIVTRMPEHLAGHVKRKLTQLKQQIKEENK